MNLYEANKQWASRPADERFWGLQDLHQHLLSEKNQSASKDVSVSQLRVQSTENDLELVGPTGVAVNFTNWSFGQLCRYADSPANYLRGLSPNLAASCLNEGLQKADSDNCQVLLRRNGSTHLRAITSTKYTRVWNASIVEALTPALDLGWMVPPARPACEDPRARPATEQDIVPGQEKFGLSIKVGDMIAPAGAFAGDRDMFCFLVNPNRVIDDGNSGLMRGVFVWNSEVGNSAFHIKTFMLENVCGNLICWGASDIRDIKLVHSGKKVLEFSGKLDKQLIAYAEQDTQQEQHLLIAARRTEIAPNQEELVTKLYGMKSLGLSQKTLNDTFMVAKQWEHTARSAPTTVWGFVHGLTRYSQNSPYMDQRHALDRAAGQILAMAV